MYTSSSNVALLPRRPYGLLGVVRSLWVLSNFRRRRRRRKAAHALALRHRQSSLLPRCHLKTTNKTAKFETLQQFFFFFALACESILIKTDSIGSRCVIGPENSLHAHPCVFRPGNVPGWGSEGVNVALRPQRPQGLKVMGRGEQDVHLDFDAAPEL